MADKVFADLVEDLLRCALHAGDRLLDVGRWIARRSPSLAAIVAVAGVWLTADPAWRGAGLVLVLLGSLLFILCAVASRYYHRSIRPRTDSSR